MQKMKYLQPGEFLFCFVLQRIDARAKLLEMFGIINNVLEKNEKTGELCWDLHLRDI
jgi:hypothetical protein